MKKLSLFIVLSSFIVFMASYDVFAAPDYEAGIKAYENKDYPAALEQFRPLAENGNAKAQEKLGFMYYKGWGVERDYKEAEKWVRKAAEQGNADDC